MLLNYQSFGEASDKPTLVIAHGLFGSARNWRAIARQLSRDRLVVAVDMRNHGNSFHDDTHDYPTMAADLGAVIRHLGAPCDLLGHSMGGKAAMVLALSEPSLISSLIIVDIAPVAYEHSHLGHIEALQALDIDALSSRKEADELLIDQIPEDMVRGFLLQSLDMDPSGNRWKINLSALEKAMDDIIGFPSVSGQFLGPTLFLRGGKNRLCR